MKYDNSIYKRFRIKLEIKDAQEKFKNKINNILFYSKIFSGEAFDFRNIIFQFCNRYGLSYEELPIDLYIKSLFEVKDFTEYILRLDTLLNVLFEENKPIAKQFAITIQHALDDSPLDLNLRIVRKTNGYQIWPKGSKLLDRSLVDDVLSILKPKKFEKVIIAFKNGLKEFLEGNKDSSKYSSAVRNMQLALDELSKVLLKDKNVGFKHLIKDKNWRKTGLNKYFRGICNQYNEMIDKMFKHKAQTKYNYAEIEAIIYMTGLLIRVIIENQKSI